MSFTIAIILTVIFAVIFNQSTRFLFKSSKHEGAAIIIAEVAAALSVILWLPLFGLDVSMPIRLWGLLILSCIFYAINDRLGATVKKHLEVSVFSVLNKSSDVFLILIGITIFKQQPTIEKIIGALFIIIGQILLTYKKGKFHLNKYFLIGLLTNLLFAIAFSIDIDTSDNMSVPIYIGITYIIPAIFIALAERLNPKTIINEFRHMNKLTLALTGISWGTYITAMITAYQKGDVITVVSISALSVLIDVLIGSVVFKEKSNFAGKVLAAILVIIGIILTVIDLSFI